MPNADFLSCWACKPNSVCRSFFSRGEPGCSTYPFFSDVWDSITVRTVRTKSGRTVIPLGRTSLCGSSDLPGSCDAPSRYVSAVLPIHAPSANRVPLAEFSWPDHLGRASLKAGVYSVLFFESASADGTTRVCGLFPQPVQACRKRASYGWAFSPRRALVLQGLKL